jgi:hypothetical protein
MGNTAGGICTRRLCDGGILAGIAHSLSSSSMGECFTDDVCRNTPSSLRSSLQTKSHDSGSDRAGDCRLFTAAPKEKTPQIPTQLKHLYRQARARLRFAAKQILVTHHSLQFTVIHGLSFSIVFGPIPLTRFRSSIDSKGPYCSRSSMIRLASVSPIPCIWTHSI